MYGLEPLPDGHRLDYGAPMRFIGRSIRNLGIAALEFVELRDQGRINDAIDLDAAKYLAGVHTGQDFIMRCRDATSEPHREFPR